MKIYQTIGLMSGTSMDGIDAALINTDGHHQIMNRASIFLPYARQFQILLKITEFLMQSTLGKINHSAELFDTVFADYVVNRLLLPKDAVINLKSECQEYLSHAGKSELSLTNIIQHSTELHYQAVKQLLEKCGLHNTEIDLLGYHGQTVFHDPKNKMSIQLGDAAYLAKLARINVVYNFRQNDIMHQGQGAPLAPLYHQALALRDQLTPCVVINCGGISNLTIVNGPNFDEVIAYDVGPGNCLLDNFVRLKTAGKQMMDVDGKFAFKGKIQQPLLKQLLDFSCIKQGQNFYQLPPPKSLDVNDICLPDAFSATTIEDGAATLIHFTAKCLVDSFEIAKIDMPNTWILAGGGFRNPAMLAELRKLLTNKIGSNFKLQHANDIGWDGDSLEAELFAYLAVRSKIGLPLSVPKTTGVLFPVSGGDFCRCD